MQVKHEHANTGVVTERRSSQSVSNLCSQLNVLMKCFLINPQPFRTYYSHGLISSNITDKRYSSYSTVQLWPWSSLNDKILLLNWMFFLISVKAISPLCCLENIPPPRIWRATPSTSRQRATRSATQDLQVPQPNTWWERLNNFTLDGLCGGTVNKSNLGNGVIWENDPAYSLKDLNPY